jgi:hypothetical protein
MTTTETVPGDVASNPAVPELRRIPFGRAVPELRLGAGWEPGLVPLRGYSLTEFTGVITVRYHFTPVMRSCRSPTPSCAPTVVAAHGILR